MANGVEVAVSEPQTAEQSALPGSEQDVLYPGPNHLGFLPQQGQNPLAGSTVL